MNYKLLIFSCSFFILHCSLFSQFSRKDQHDIYYTKKSFETDKLNHRGTLYTSLSNNFKSGSLSYIGTIPVANISKGLKLDIHIGARAGLWKDKINGSKKDPNVGSDGFLVIPIGTGLSFRLLNPFNISFDIGGVGGVEVKNIITKSNDGLTDAQTEKVIPSYGYYASADIFFPVMSGFAIDAGITMFNIRYINKLPYLSLGLVFGGD